MKKLLLILVIQLLALPASAELSKIDRHALNKLFGDNIEHPCWAAYHTFLGKPKAMAMRDAAANYESIYSPVRDVTAHENPSVRVLVHHVEWIKGGVSRTRLMKCFIQNEKVLDVGLNE